MDSFVYFAYGSNMLTERLRARCPSAEPIGTAYARGYKICFEKKSKKDKSGKATLMSRDSNSDKIHGLLFQINKSELGLLDRVEGKDSGYYRDDWFPVTSTENGNILSVPYIAEELVRGLSPFDWYLALIVAGAMQHELPKEYIECLRVVETTRDVNSKTIDVREEALKILKNAGTKYESVYQEIAERAK